MAKPKTDLPPLQAPARLNNFADVPGYATRANAVRRLSKALHGVPLDQQPTTLVAVSPEGRFIPVAVGERALQLGLHFSGIVVIN
jgi:hypothetical protein